jgi:uncharacterized membrane protein YhaH (DUF805 family)
MNLLGRHLSGLIDFNGRENRQPFWLWVLTVMATATIAWMFAFVPLFVGTFGRIEQFARDHPDQVMRTVGPGSYSIQVHGDHPELMPDIGMLLPLLAIIALVGIVLLAAAVVRRLHDSGRSGWWGIVPLPFLFSGLALSSMVFGSFTRLAASNADPDPAVFKYFALLMLNNLLYLGTIGLLIVLLSLAGTQGDNRYGRDPLGT